MPARLYIGTSSWAEKPLIDSGKFYPQGVRGPEAQLRYYAERFDLVEVDSSYYALPSKRNAVLWAERTPEGFLFDVKAFALFTAHPAAVRALPASARQALNEKAAKKPRVYARDLPAEALEELWRIFRFALRPLREAGKLGAVLLDFPPWFGPSTENRRVLVEARERLPECPVVVEFRNAAWVAEGEAEKTFALLREHDAGFAAVDEPQGLKSSFPPLVAVTGPLAAVRFRGRNTETWEQPGLRTAERLNWWYSDDELRGWLPRIQQLAAEADQVHLIFNTKAEDQGVANAARMQELLGLRRRPG